MTKLHGYTKGGNKIGQNESHYHHAWHIMVEILEQTREITWYLVEFQMLCYNGTFRLPWLG